jgi:hypothetical protein
MESNATGGNRITPIGGNRPAIGSGIRPAAAPPPVPPAGPAPVEEPAPVVDEPISLVEENDSTSGSAVRAFGAASRKAMSRASQFKRTPRADGTGAVRCRIFHSRIAVAPLEYMENQINDWLDGEEIEVKHVGQVIGVMEGKTAEPNLLVMVWY